MKSLKIILLCFVFLAPLIFPSLSSAEVRVLLKNGNSIIAEDCRDAGPKLICERMGGTFEIDKKDVLNLKEITIQLQETSEGQEQSTEEGAKGNKEEKEKTAADVKGTEKTETEKRLDRINQRKLELRTEREKLIKDREQLQEDIKKEGVIRSTDKIEALTKRDIELKNRIDKFNEEADKLDNEERKILEGLKK